MNELTLSKFRTSNIFISFFDVATAKTYIQQKTHANTEIKQTNKNSKQNFVLKLVAQFENEARFSRAMPAGENCTAGRPLRLMRP